MNAILTRLFPGRPIPSRFVRPVVRTAETPLRCECGSRRRGPRDPRSIAGHATERGRTERTGILHMRYLKRTVGVLATAAGIAALTAGPAMAAPNWQVVNTTSNWHCGSTLTHTGASGVSFQTC